MALHRAFAVDVAAILQGDRSDEKRSPVERLFHQDRTTTIGRSDSGWRQRC